MGKHFDELSKGLASGMSRRRALGRFLGGVVGAALATLMPGRTSAAAGPQQSLAGDGVYGFVNAGPPKFVVAPPGFVNAPPSFVQGPPGFVPAKPPPFFVNRTTPP
jgi:hypothetical protein